MSIDTTSTKAPLFSAGPVGRGLDNYDIGFRSKDLIDTGELKGHYSYLMTGCVVEVNQQLQGYKVRVGDGADYFATTLQASGQSLGLDLCTSQLYSVGAEVLMLSCRHLGPQIGVIIGVVPLLHGPILYSGSPELTVSSPVGSEIDQISKYALNSQSQNYNGGRPIDVYPADLTILNTFGAGLFVGALHTTLRASTECAVECHLVDSLLRVTSYNYEQFTAGADNQLFSDSGDYTEIKRSNPYVIESVGGTDQYGSFPKSTGAARTNKEAYTGKYKPEVEDQIGWWRMLDLSGYLANVKLQFVLVPKLNGTRAGAGTQEDQDEHAVFREHVDSSGAYSVASAKSISFIKDCLIPAPREQYRPDDSRGDRKEDILEARTTNEPNLKDASIKAVTENSPHASLMYAAASSDLASFRTHRSLVMFRERAKDWTLKEIDEVDLAGFKSAIDSSGFISAATGVSQGNMYAKLPQVGKLNVTAKEEVTYFASRSMVMMHEDGSIHIQDGYGSAISMRGGGIDISCPGDITMRPGRNLVALAGESASIIGGVDIELCSHKGDIRVQADRNVSILGGNDGFGGILLESKATFSPLVQEDNETFKAPITNSNPYRGIWFKAPRAAICSLAGQTYIGNVNTEGTKTACKVVIDCASEEFQVRGRTSRFLTRSSEFITNKDNPNLGTSLNIQDQGGFQLNTKGSFYFQGGSFYAGGAGAGGSADLNLYLNGTLNVTGATYLESLAVKVSGGGGSLVPAVKDEIYEKFVKKPITKIFNQFDKAITAQLDALKELLAEMDNSLLLADSSSLKNLTFWYPDSDLRGIPTSTEYVLIESDWQKAYTEVGATFEFKGISATGPSSASSIDPAQSYCWPGALALSSKYGKLNNNSRFVDSKLLFKKDGFEEPIDLIDAPKSFEKNYVIIRSNQIRSK